MSMITDGMSQRFDLTVPALAVGADQTEFVYHGSHKIGGNDLTKIIPYSAYVGTQRAATDGRDWRPTSDTAGTTQLPFHLIAYNPNVASGTNSSTLANNLVDATADFIDATNFQKPKIGDRVFNVTSGATALITAVVSDTQLTLNADIFPVASGTGKTYRIVRFYFAIRRTLSNSVSTNISLWCGNSSLSAIPDNDANYGRNKVYNVPANPYLAQWNLTEPDATDAVDSTGNGYTGTSAGTNKPESTDGIFAYGQFLSGNNGTPAVEDRFNIGGSAVAAFQGNNTSPPTAFTVAGWFRASGSTAAQQTLWGKRDPGTNLNGYELQLANSPKKLQFVLDYGTRQYNIVGSTTLNTTDYYHVMVSIPSNGVPADVIMTVNGVQETVTITMSGTTVDSGSTTTATTNKIIQSGQNFLTTCNVDDTVYMTATGLTAKVVSVDSNTQLTVDRDIAPAPTGKAFEVYAKGNVNHGETLGLGSREGASSTNVFEGSIENICYINNAQMTVAWALAQYNNIASMATFTTCAAGVVYNEFTSTYYDLKKKVTIRSKPTYILSTRTNYISVITETEVPASFWTYVQNGGGPIRICTNSDGTGQIPIEVSICNTSTKKLAIFLKKTVTFGGGDKIFMFAKKITANSIYQPHEDNTNGTFEVWSHKNYKGVWHLEETGSGAANEYRDSSGTGNHGQGSNAPSLATGKIQSGQQGNGSNQRIVIGDTGFMTGSQNGTMSAWINLTGDTSEQTPFGYGTDADGQRRVIQQRDQGCGGHISNAFWGVANLYSGWTHITWLFPTGATTLNQTRMFINGIEMLTSNAEPFKLKLLTGTNLTLNTVKSFSQLLRGTAGLYSSVPVDECRITTDQLTSDDIYLNYFNQLASKNLWELVPDEKTNLRGRLQNFYGGFQ